MGDVLQYRNDIKSLLCAMHKYIHIINIIGKRKKSCL